MEGAHRQLPAFPVLVTPRGTPLQRVILDVPVVTEEATAIVEKTDADGRTSRLVRKTERNRTPGAFSVRVGDQEQHREG